MASKFVEIEEGAYRNLEKIAKDKGYPSVEKLLTDFANKFSLGCSSTELKNQSSKAA